MGFLACSFQHVIPFSSHKINILNIILSIIENSILFCIFIIIIHVNADDKAQVCRATFQLSGHLGRNRLTHKNML